MLGLRHVDLVGPAHRAALALALGDMPEQALVA